MDTLAEIFLRELQEYIPVQLHGAFDGQPFKFGMNDLGITYTNDEWTFSFGFKKVCHSSQLIQIHWINTDADALYVNFSSSYQLELLARINTAVRGYEQEIYG